MTYCRKCGEYFPSRINARALGYKHELVEFQSQVNGKHGHIPEWEKNYLKNKP